MKYCVLCRAEYRDAVSACTTCHASLVSSLDSEEARSNPSRLLWTGKDSSEFELIVRGLRDANIPAYAEERPSGLFGGLVKSASDIHVLAGDFDAALSVAARVIHDRGRLSIPQQHCHACGARCAASLAACPSCQTILIVERKKAIEPVTSVAMKYCPLCDAEYSGAHTRCTVCSVELVPEELRGRPLDERQRKERLELVWRGGDPGALSEVIEILRGSGIRHHVQPTSDHLVFELGMPRPKYLVRTLASDSARAKELLAGVNETSPFVSMEDSALALAQEPAEPRRSPNEWKPAAATVAIWTGEDAAVARLLQDCLRENGIGVRCLGKSPGIVNLLIMPADEAAAREIVREIREASPPA